METGIQSKENEELVNKLRETAERITALQVQLDKNEAAQYPEKLAQMV